MPEDPQILYPDRIKEAIDFAAFVHRHQTRKANGLPYLTHLWAVSLILARTGADEDVIVAGILHDTIEDSHPDEKVTKAMIAKKFGAEVAALVDIVTEDKSIVDWEERKRQDLACLVCSGNHDAILVRSADMIANLTDTIADYKTKGDEIFKYLHGSKFLQTKVLLLRTGALASLWPENPLLLELHALEGELLELWRDKQ